MYFFKRQQGYIKRLGFPFLRKRFPLQEAPLPPLRPGGSPWEMEIRYILQINFRITLQKVKYPK
ncbi:hypothetical protein CJU73_14930 [Pseudomonas fragi]|nr:hypothetical protein CJU73_14930 [Pseudomonas fragi]